jgi:hypothetical protein
MDTPPEPKSRHVQKSEQASVPGRMSLPGGLNNAPVEISHAPCLRVDSSPPFPLPFVSTFLVARDNAQ